MTVKGGVGGVHRAGSLEHDSPVGGGSEPSVFFPTMYGVKVSQKVAFEGSQKQFSRGV